MSISIVNAKLTSQPLIRDGLMRVGLALIVMEIWWAGDDMPDDSHTREAFQRKSRELKKRESGVDRRGTNGACWYRDPLTWNARRVWIRSVH